MFDLSKRFSDNGSLRAVLDGVSWVEEIFPAREKSILTLSRMETELSRRIGIFEMKNIEVSSREQQKFLQNSG